MDTIITEIKASFRRGDVVTKFIYANVFIYLLITVVLVINRLFVRNAVSLVEIFALPASVSRILHQPWSLFTYMWMHVELFHLFFNALWLYCFGKLFLRFFSAKHFVGTYVFSGLMGGLFYVVSYNLFPYFSGVLDYSTMVGASAAVLGLVAAVAYREPNYQIRLMFFGNVQLKWLALCFLILDMCLVTSENGGGHLSHLGGALGGFLFALFLNRGVDITRWIVWIVDKISSLFERKPRQPKMKVNYGSRAADYEFNARRKERDEEIDRILDKIKLSGYESLPAAEKKTLFDVSRR